MKPPIRIGPVSSPVPIRANIPKPLPSQPIRIEPIAQGVSYGDNTLPTNFGGFNSTTAPIPSGRRVIRGRLIKDGPPQEVAARYQKLQRIQAERGNARLQRELQDSLTFNPQKQGGINTSFGRKGNSGFLNVGALNSGFQASRKGLNSLAAGAGILADGFVPGAGALFAGGQTAGAALAASPLLGAAAIGATAYGGFKAGGAAYRAFNSKSFEGLDEGTTEATQRAAKLAMKEIKAGKSSSQIKSIIDAQITSTQGQIKEAKSGIGNFGLKDETKGLEQAVQELKQLRESIDAAKEQNDAAKRAEQAQEKLIAALEALANGGSSGGKTTIEVEISLKDADKLPEIFSNKVIKPLEEQIKALNNKTYNIEQKVGIGPQPSTV